VSLIKYPPRDDDIKIYEKILNVTSRWTMFVTNLLEFGASNGFQTVNSLSRVHNYELLR